MEELQEHLVVVPVWGDGTAGEAADLVDEDSLSAPPAAAAAAFVVEAVA